MQLPPSDRHDECDCIESNCAQCKRPIGSHLHYRDIEEMNWSTMEFESLGPMHRACVQYHVLGYDAEMTWKLLLVEARVN